MLYTGIVKGAPKWRPIAVVAALFLIFTGLNIFGEYRSSDPHYQHIIFGALALLSQHHFCLHFDQMGPSRHFTRRTPTGLGVGQCYDRSLCFWDVARIFRARVES
jgi:hypothetical protein